MTTRTITIEDTLYDDKDTLIESVKEQMEYYIKDNQDDDYETWLEDEFRYNGLDHELVDSAVPIYYHEIDAAWYLHKDILKEAFENSGCYSKNEKPDNYEQVCIYFWLEQELNEWLNEEGEETYNRIKGEL